MSPAPTETLEHRDLGAPRVVPPLVAALRRRLVEAEFTEAGIRTNASVGAVDAWSLAAGQPAADSSPFSTLLTLFWFGAPLDVNQVRTAIDPVRVEDLEALGVADARDGRVHPASSFDSPKDCSSRAISRRRRPIRFWATCRPAKPWRDCRSVGAAGWHSISAAAAAFKACCWRRIHRIQRRAERHGQSGNARRQLGSRPSTTNASTRSRAIHRT
jgi:hypothetical protein